MITIKDIASALGCSVSTVSRALQDNACISAEKRAKIQAYAREHHYMANPVAASLRGGGRLPVVGVVLPQFDHYYFSTILSGVEDYLRVRGYGVMVAHTEDEYAREVEACEHMRRARVAGLICSQAKDTQRYDHFEALTEAGTPLCFVDRICTGLRTSRVVVDDYAGALAATEYLIRTGCRRICFLGAPMTLEISKNRYNGYRDAMRRAGLEIDPRWVRKCDSRAQAEGYTPLLMSLENAPDAAFCMNDETALGVLYTARRIGLRVPEDVSVCGFADGIAAVSADPQLTTVEQRGREVGQEAARLLLDKIEGRAALTAYTSAVVRTKLVVRGTTQRLAP